MPNWCENDLFVTGERKNINIFLNKIITNKSLFDFNAIIPMPKELGIIATSPEEGSLLWLTYQKNIEKFGYANWYDWCIEYWGTKWNADFPSIHSGYTRGYSNLPNNTILIKFNTAWDPPKPIILKASEQHSLLKFALRYYEHGCAYKGRYACKKGEILCDRMEEYNGKRGG